MPQAAPPPRGGRKTRHELAPPVCSNGITGWTRGANSFGASGGGVGLRTWLDTPTRCVQRLGPAAAFASRSPTAGPNRGRIALPLVRDEGDAFAAGGGGSDAARRQHRGAGLDLRADRVRICAGLSREPGAEPGPRRADDARRLHAAAHCIAVLEPLGGCHCRRRGTQLAHRRAGLSVPHAQDDGRDGAGRGARPRWRSASCCAAPSC